MKEQLSNEQIIERVNAWQDAGFVHPLTCVNSKHGNLYPVIENGKVVLRCHKCKYDQVNIPPSVLSITPEQMKEEKEKLKTMGFKFDQSEIMRRNRVDLMIPAEKKILEAIWEIETIGADTRLTEAQTLLSKAKDLVSDYHDKIPKQKP